MTTKTTNNTTDKTSSTALVYDLKELFKNNILKDICDYIDKYPQIINKIDDCGELPLNVAISVNNEEIFKHLLGHHVDVNMKDQSNKSPLMCAYNYKNMVFFDALLLRGAHDPNVVALVQQDHNVRYAKVLSDFGVSLPNIMSPLHLAAAGGNLEDVKWLLSIIDYQKVNINDKSYNGMLPLHLASMHGHKDIVVELLSKNSLINVQDTQLKTPLMYAIINKYPEVVKNLLNATADVNLIDANRRTALSYAAGFNYYCGDESIEEQEKNAEIVKLLLDAGAETGDVTQYATITIPLSNNRIQFSFYPSYPIILAIINGNIRAVELLLDYGVDVNTCDLNGKTGLMYAAENGRFEIAKLLVERGADIFTTWQQETINAMWFAEINNRDEISQLLEDMGCSRFYEKT